MTKQAATLDTKKAQELRGVFRFEFDDKSPSIPEWIHLIPIGQWEHDAYGPIIISASDINEYKFNFDNGVRKGVFITAGHEGFAELPAQGWIKAVEARPTGLWGQVEWNEIGKTTLSDKQYKFFSPELWPVYEDPETHQFYRNVISGGALTKSPYFKELEAIIFSEKNIHKNKFNDTMDIQALIAKNVADLSAEEVAFLKANREALTDEQKAALTSVLDVESAEEKEAREKKEADEKAAADQAAADKEAADKAAADAAAAGEAAAGAALSEKGTVQISASELAILRKKADEGQQAFAELQKTKLDNSVTALVFSESNKTGTFLPKSKDKLRAFMETLNEAQRAQFSGLLVELPKSNLFSEAGISTAAAEGTAQAEVEAKVASKIKADSKLSYSEALKQVMSENVGLEERYDRELVPLRNK